MTENRQELPVHVDPLQPQSGPYNIKMSVLTEYLLYFQPNGIPPSCYLPMSEADWSQHLASIRQELPLHAATLQAADRAYNMKVTILSLYMLYFQPNGVPPSCYLPMSEADWSQHLTSIRQELPLDAATLQAAARAYNMKVSVLTTRGRQHVIRPREPHTSHLHLGHVIGNKFIILNCK